MSIVSLRLASSILENVRLHPRFSYAFKRLCKLYGYQFKKKSNESITAEQYIEVSDILLELLLHAESVAIEKYARRSLFMLPKLFQLFPRATYPPF